MMTQVNVGMSGAVGLRYESLPTVLDALQIPAADRLDVLDRLRVIESTWFGQHG